MRVAEWSCLVIGILIGALVTVIVIAVLMDLAKRRSERR